MEEARDSISTTVTEIKETVAQQVETVKDALDWREHFKKQPVAWSLGAMGVGFLTGYCIAAMVKGDSHESQDESDYPLSVRLGYSSSQPLAGQHAMPRQYADSSASISPRSDRTNGHDAEEKGPGLFERFKETSAYDRLSKEVGTLGDRVVDELAKTAQQVVLPALLMKLKNLIGLDLSSKTQERETGRSNQATAGTQDRSGSQYQPVSERPV
jgi:hypothetical protein